MIEFFCVWTFVANYGTMRVDARTPEEAAERVFRGFSEEFRQKGRVMVWPSPPAFDSRQR